MPADSVWRSVADRHLAALGLVEDAAGTSDGPGHYRSADGSRSAYLAVQQGTGLGLWLDDGLVQLSAPEALASAFVSLASELAPDLARTDGESGTHTITDDELGSEGRVRTLHWFQYFGASVAQRWPAETFDALPDCRVIRCPDDAVAIQFLGSPSGGYRCRFAAAALGIDLPPVRGRNPATGEPIWIPHG